MKSVVLFLLLVLFTSTIFSQEFDSIPQVDDDESLLIDDLIISSTPSSDTSKPAPDTVGTVSYGKFIFALFVVALMLFTFYLFVKKKYGVKASPINGGNLDVLEEISVGINKMYIVRAGNRAYVVGSGTGGLNLIHTFDSKETIDILSSYDEGTDGTTSGKFSEIMNGFLDKYKEK